MSIPAFSSAWADAFLLAINSDPAYRHAGRSWKNPVALVVEPGDGMAHGAAIQADLEAGVCLSAAAVAPAEVSAPFVLSGNLAAWKDIVSGGSDPIMAVARGKVKLTRGSLGALMLHANAARALVVCAQQIDTQWPQ